MSVLVAIVGQSGTGKSTSMRHLNPQETIIINVANKPLPFKGWKSNYKAGKLSEGANYINTENPSTMIQALNYINSSLPNIKHVVIDDFQYVMAFEFMAKANEKGFDKFTSMAKNAFDVINTAKNLHRDDLIIFISCHEETTNENFQPKRKIKTIGKLIDDKITLEGLFSIVLFTEVKVENGKKPEYYFVTQTDGITTAKSPEGMFEDILIPNDLSFVSSQIYKYFN